MYAVIKSGGKQHRVIEGETLNKKITYKQDLDELKEILEFKL